jgi:hypothetical protein
MKPATVFTVVREVQHKGGKREKKKRVKNKKKFSNFQKDESASTRALK